MERQKSQIFRWKTVWIISLWNYIIGPTKLPQRKGNRQTLKKRKYERISGEKRADKNITKSVNRPRGVQWVWTHGCYVLPFLSPSIFDFWRYVVWKLFPSTNVMVYIIAHDSDFRNPLFEKKWKIFWFSAKNHEIKTSGTYPRATFTFFFRFKTFYLCKIYDFELTRMI